MRLIRDALGGVIPQTLDNGEYTVLANGDVSGVDFGKHKLLRDALGDVLPYQYFDVEQGKFVAGVIGGGSGSGDVTSVNGKRGSVQLRASDVGAVSLTEFEEYISKDLFSQYASDVDDNDIYRVVEIKRPDGTLYLMSVLSNPNNDGDYLNCLWTYYDATGLNVIDTVSWSFTYDNKGNITSKVVE